MMRTEWDPEQISTTEPVPDLPPARKPPARAVVHDWRVEWADTEEETPVRALDADQAERIAIRKRYGLLSLTSATPQQLASVAGARLA